jgi:hypothetical protein
MSEVAVRDLKVRVRRGCLVALLLLPVVAAGCSGGPGAAGSGGAAPATSAAGSGAPAAGASATSAAAPSARIGDIEKIIAQTSNSDDAFVEFHDVSDLPRDRIDRGTQFTCDGRECNVVVMCDGKSQPTCASIAPKLVPLGNFVRLKPQYQALEFDSSPGGAHDHALLAEKIFLEVLGAAADYELTWQSAVQKSPAPVPTA